MAALCAGTIAAGERVSHLAWTEAAIPPASPALSITSWRRIAAASTATSHHCHLLLTAIAARYAEQPDSTPAATDALTRAATTARISRTAWLRTGRVLGAVTTDVRWHPSPAAAESADLAWWTGRLTYADPDWTPSQGPGRPARDSRELAREPADVIGVITALHHVTEAVDRLAIATHAQLNGAANARRILLPAKDFPDGSATLSSFAPAPFQRIAELRKAIGDARDASRSLVTAMDAVAVEVHARSSVLATARAAVRPLARTVRRRRAEREPAQPPEQQTGLAGISAASLESVLRERGVTNPRLLWHAAGIDDLARQVLTDALGRRAQRDDPASHGQRDPASHRKDRPVSAARSLIADPGHGHSLAPEPEAEP
jgi:hypothetical protein